MPVNVKIKQAVIYSDLPAPPPGENPIEYNSRANIRNDGAFDDTLVDQSIANRDARRSLPDDAAVVCITLHAGERLGEITLNVQLEGKAVDGDKDATRYNRCLANQGDLLDAASDWLGELLAELGGNFETTIAAVPCPEATDHLSLQNTINHLVRLPNKHVQNPDIKQGQVNDVTLGNSQHH